MKFPRFLSRLVLFLVGLAAGSIAAYGQDPGTVKFSSATYSASEPVSGSTSVTITVSRVGGMDGAISVDVFDTTQGSAQSGQDYVFPSNSSANTYTLSWGDQDSSDKSLTITVNGSTSGGTLTGGNTGTIDLVLQNAQPASGGPSIGSPSSATVTLFSGAGEVVFSSASYSLTQLSSSSEPLIITVSRINGSAGAVTVDVDVTGGTANEGVDYTAPSSPTVSWADGDTTDKTITFTVNGGTIAAGSSSTIDLALENPTGGVSDATSPNTEVVTLFGNESGSFSFSSTTYTATEPPSGTVPLTITVNRSNGSSGQVMVNVVITDGTAVSGVDYTPQSPSPITLTFSDGDSTPQSVTITVNSGTIPSGSSKTFLVALQDPVGGAVISKTSNTATVTLSGYAPGALAFDSATYLGDQPTATTTTLNVMVDRTGGADGAISVEVAITGGTATNGVDFTLAAPITLNWADQDATPKMVTITLNSGNTIPPKTSKTIVLGLQNPIGGATLGTQTSTTITLQGVYAGALSFSSATYGGTDGGIEYASGTSSIVVSVTRSLGFSGNITANVTLSGTPTARAGIDYTLPTPITLTWGDGDGSPKTFPVTVIGGSLKPNAMASLTLVISSATLNPAQTDITGPDITGISSTTVTLIGDDGTPPTVALTSPAATSKPFTTPSITLEGTAADNVSVKSVQIILNGAPTVLTPATPIAKYLWSEPLTLAPGTNVVTVTATDEQGNVSAAVTRTFLLDAIVVTLTKPAANAHLMGTTTTMTGSTTTPVTFGGAVTDADSKATSVSVNVALNGGAQSAATVTANMWSISLTLEPGLNTVTVTATDSAGNVATPLTSHVTFTNNRPLLAGPYSGVLAATGTGAPFDTNGLVVVTVTKTGSFTGKLFLSGAVLPLSGVFSTEGGALFGKTLTSTMALTKTTKQTKGPATKTALGSLSLTLNPSASPTVTANLTDANSNPIASVTAPQAFLGPGVSLAKGTYTVSLQPAAAPNNGQAAAYFPQGDGYGTVTVTSYGFATIVGKLADGFPFSYSNYVSQSGSTAWPVFIPLYFDNTGLFNGYLAGTVQFVQGSPGSASASMTWLKQGGIFELQAYPNGWPMGIDVAFAGSPFTPPLKGNNVLEIALSANTITVSLADGGLTTNTTNQASIDANSHVTVVPPTIGAAAVSNLVLSFAPASGLMSGSFTHPVTGATVPFSGIVSQGTESASGYFIFTPTGATANGVQSTSGLITVAAAH